MENAKWIIREPKSKDISFIYSTFLNSYHYDSWTKSVKKTVYFDNYKLVIDRLLDNSKIYVAHDPDDEDIIYGYMIFEPKIIHYIFVKEPFRNFGIARSLFNHVFEPNDEVTITHKTKTLVPIVIAKKQLVFNPFILFTKGTHGT